MSVKEIFVARRSGRITQNSTSDLLVTEEDKMAELKVHYMVLWKKF